MVSTVQNTLGADIMMQLGGYAFSVSTAAYQELSRSAEQRWPSQERFGKRPALQYTGPGPESITLQGVVFPEYRGGVGQLNAMRDLAAAGKPLLLVDGLGGVHGRWVIGRVEERANRFGAAGVARRQEFSLALTKLDDGDPAALGGADDIASVASVTSAVAQPFTSPAEAATAVGGLVTSSGKTAEVVARSLGSSIARIQGVAAQLGASSTSSALGALSRAVGASGSLVAALGDATGLLSTTPTTPTTRAAAGGILQAASDSTTLANSSSVVLGRMLDGLSAAGASHSVVDAVRGGLLSANQLMRLCRETAASSSDILGRIG